jgi:formylglycine-generating enzyme required for sulfatase activity
MKYFILIAIFLLLVSCSEQPARDNPYDLSYDLPEPEIISVEHISLSTKLLTWEYELDNIEGFMINRREDTVWQEGVMVSPDQRTYLDTAVAVNKHIQYKIKAMAGENESDYVTSVILDNMIPYPTNLRINVIGGGIISLTWGYVSEGITGFKIDKKAVGDTWELYEDDIESGSREWEDNNCHNNDSYRIKAYFQEYESQTSNEVKFMENMEYVEGGTFEMGDQFNEGDGDELPVHEVAVSSFYIGIHEVTQEEYEALMGFNPSHDYGIGDDYPVYYVSWHDVVEYCNALSEYEGLTQCYNLSDWSCDFSANGYRLPTEVEWEYAARGGVNWEDNYKYSGVTDNLSYYGWYHNNSGGQIHEVGTKLPNQLGIFDMSGNVWEWCNDWYSSNYYETSPEENPTGPNTGSYRVLRGGSWSSNAGYCRCANRDTYSPASSFNYLGFRLVCGLN